MFNIFLWSSETWVLLLRSRSLFTHKLQALYLFDRRKFDSFNSCKKDASFIMFHCNDVEIDKLYTFNLTTFLFDFTDWLGWQWNSECTGVGTGSWSYRLQAAGLRNTRPHTTVLKRHHQRSTQLWRISKGRKNWTLTLLKRKRQQNVFNLEFNEMH